MSSPSPFSFRLGRRKDREIAPRIEWKPPPSPVREYLEVLLAIAGVTVAGWFVPLTYRALGHVYLVAVIFLCVRVGRGPALFAAIISALAWNYVFIPPQFSFSILTDDEGLELGAYFCAALIAGQLTARIRAQEIEERTREHRATALFFLTRALAEARSLEDALTAALRQADALFGARTALLLPSGENLQAHPCSSLQLSAKEIQEAEKAWFSGSTSATPPQRVRTAVNVHVPMVRAGVALGVFVIALPAEAKSITPQQRDLIDAFAAHIGLLLEREELRAASEREKMLAESERLHRTLLESVSHEFKTPLAVLRAATEALPQSDAERRNALVREIQTAMTRLDRLVANVLGQTRVEAGAVRPQLEWCDARDLIAAARKNLSDALASRKVTVSIPEDIPMFKVDAALTEQALGNLLLNAVMHTPPSTPIAIRAGLDGKRVFLQVADRGNGIPPELREHLFHKFRRGKEAKAGGLGLGLSIVHGFVLAQGGEVLVGENPGGGAVFTIYLPFVEQSSVPHE